MTAISPDFLVEEASRRRPPRPSPPRGGRPMPPPSMTPAVHLRGSSPPLWSTSTVAEHARPDSRCDVENGKNPSDGSTSRDPGTGRPHCLVDARRAEARRDAAIRLTRLWADHTAKSRGQSRLPASRPTRRSRTWTGSQRPSHRDQGQRAGRIRGHRPQTADDREEAHPRHPRGDTARAKMARTAGNGPTIKHERSFGTWRVGTTTPQRRKNSLRIAPKVRGSVKSVQTGLRRLFTKHGRRALLPSIIDPNGRTSATRHPKAEGRLVETADEPVTGSTDHRWLGWTGTTYWFGRE